jgi:hypothetical protein
MPGEILKQKRIAKGMAVLRIITGLLMAYHGWEFFQKKPWICTWAGIV